MSQEKYKEQAMLNYFQSLAHFIINNSSMHKGACEHVRKKINKNKKFHVK